MSCIFLQIFWHHLTALRRLDNIVKVVREGQTRRAPLERVADQITGYFVPVITLLAVITWLVWLILGFSGALPADYLDIEVGGWSKFLPLSPCLALLLPSPLPCPLCTIIFLPSNTYN